jgi:two-component system, LytTR family, sensor kinase
LNDGLLLYSTIDALCFAAGAALCLLMGLLQVRAPQAIRGQNGLILLWLCGGIWSASSFVSTMMALQGVAPTSTAARIAGVMAWSSSCIGPFLAMRSVALGLGGRLPFGRTLTAIGTLASLGLLGGFIYSALDPNDGFDLMAAAIVSFFTSLGFLVLSGALYFARRERKPQRARRRYNAPLGKVVLGFWLIFIALTLFNILTPPSAEPYSQILGRINQHWPITVSILAALSLARTHYADVVLKRSVVVLLAIFIPAWIAWNTPGLPKGAPLVMATLPASILILAAPYFYKGMSFFIDRVILQRPDYVKLAVAYGRAARKAADAVELESVTQQAIHDALGLQAKIGIELDDDTEVLDLGPNHTVGLSPKGKAQSMLEAERRFLYAVGMEYDARREAMFFEAERRERELHEATLKAAVAEAELKALRAQVDPHFLFNTLNAVAGLIATDPDKAEAMTERLAAFFRYTLDRQDRTTATVDEELDFARQYLEIEKVRFGDRLQVDIRKDKGLGQEAAPPLILQPLVENAIRHGLASKLEGGRIEVDARREGDRIRLSVTDDGVGFSSKSKPRVGLSNVRERLRAMYGDAAEMTVEKGPGGRGASIVLMLPA